MSNLSDFIAIWAGVLIIMHLFLMPFIDDIMTPSPEKLNCKQVGQRLVNGTSTMSDRMISQYTAYYTGKCLQGLGVTK